MPMDPQVGIERGPHDEKLFIAGQDYKSGEVAQIDGWAGIVRGASGVKTGEAGVLSVKGRVDIPKASATVFAGGATVEWDNTNKLAVTTAGDFVLGKAERPGANGDTVVSTFLNG